jgi:hypothetical protein
MRNGFLGEGRKRGRSEEQGQLNHHHHQLDHPITRISNASGTPQKRKIETCLTSYMHFLSGGSRRGGTLSRRKGIEIDCGDG